eukprot:COSAG01_NODE_6048_length_3880_cov_21.012431_1_plen_221_part_00
MVGRPMASMTHDEGDRVLLRLSARDYFLPACIVTVYTDVAARHTSRCAAYNSLPSVLSSTTFTAAPPLINLGGARRQANGPHREPAAGTCMICDTPPLCCPSNTALQCIQCIQRIEPYGVHSSDRVYLFIIYLYSVYSVSMVHSRLPTRASHGWTRRPILIVYYSKVKALHASRTYGNAFQEASGGISCTGTCISPKLPPQRVIARLLRHTNQLESTRVN